MTQIMKMDHQLVDSKSSIMHQTASFGKLSPKICLFYFKLASIAPIPYFMSSKTPFNTLQGTDSMTKIMEMGHQWILKAQIVTKQSILAHSPLKLSFLNQVGLKDPKNLFFRDQKSLEYIIGHSSYVCKIYKPKQASNSNFQLLIPSK